MNNKTYWADLSLVFVALIWGSTFFIIKDTQNYISPITLLAYRFLLATVLMGLFLYFIQRKPLFKNYKQGFILGIILSLSYITQSIGLIYISASSSGFITGLFVVFVPLFSVLFLKKIPSIKNFVALAMSLVGLWILTGGVHNMNKGDLITLVCAMLVALHILYVSKLVKTNVDPYILNFQQLFTAAVVCLGSTLALRQSFAISNPAVIGSTLYLSVFAILLAFLIQNLAQKSVPPLRASLIFTMEPVFGAIFAWTLGGENFVPVRALGGLLVFLAMIVSELPLEDWLFKKPAEKNIN